MKTPSVLVVAFALLFASCATKPKVDPNRDWSALIGNYSYAQALAELGRPYVTGEQSDGSRFAEWVLHRSPQFSFGFGAGTGTFGPHSSVGVGAGTTVSPPAHGEYLRLDFGANELLNAWTKIRH
jgi:hypothetical protein